MYSFAQRWREFHSKRHFMKTQWLSGIPCHACRDAFGFHLEHGEEEHGVFSLSCSILCHKKYLQWSTSLEAFQAVRSTESLPLFYGILSASGVLHMHF